MPIFISHIINLCGIFDNYNWKGLILFFINFSCKSFFDSSGVTEFAPNDLSAKINRFIRFQSSIQTYVDELTTLVLSHGSRYICGPWVGHIIIFKHKNCTNTNTLTVWSVQYLIWGEDLFFLNVQHKDSIPAILWSIGSLLNIVNTWTA